MRRIVPVPIMSPAADDDPEREETPMGRLILGTLIGFAVTFLVVMAVTWGAMAAIGLEMGGDVTAAYLVLNLLGSFLAAGLGGYVAVSFSARMAAAWGVAGVILGMSVVAMLGETSGSQPAWYPAVLAALGVGGALAGGALAHRRGRPMETL